MLFTEPAFLFAFLPLLLAAYFAAPERLRNVVLTLASIAFYALGEWKFLPFLIGSIALNYVLAILIEQHRGRRWGKTWLVVGIISDLGLLVVFKYLGWLAANLDALLRLVGAGSIAVPTILLPLGISFFTFHKISYKVDVYRGETDAQRNPLTLALYILLFPQLIAGPIVRYRDIADQLARRSVDVAQFAHGIRRFMIGIAKKIIVANTVGAVADNIFAVPGGHLGVTAAWLGIVCYTLQIYFDFSGYSDMAIGLARLFGFELLENFNYPYASRSITEFWRRWHISLSRWFRDYLYIPLGGNRGSARRTYLNLVTVFFLCGLWHGASWEFVVWGVFHGVFLVLERRGFGEWLAAAPRAIATGYTLLVVMSGWVFFRAGSLDHALEYLRAMFLGGGTGAVGAAQFLDPWLVLVLVCGSIAAFPLRTTVAQRLGPGTPRIMWTRVVALAALFGLFIVSLTMIAAGTYNPFLYFRF